MRWMPLIAAAAVLLSGCGSFGEFDAGAWREAAAADDTATMQTQARRAVRGDALTRMPEGELRRTLGEPHRRFRDDTVWAWGVGLVGDTLGPGDAASFYVTLDAGTRRVVHARIAEAY